MASHNYFLHSVIFFSVLIVRSTSFPMNQINYVGQLIEHHLGHCSTIIFLDEYQLSNADSVNQLLSSTYNWQKDVFLFYNSDAKDASSVRSRFNRVLDVHKWRHECKQVITLFKQPTEERMEAAYNVIKRMRGIVLKNHDYFLFLTEPSWTEMLLKSKFGTRVTNKVAIEMRGLATPRLNTVCVYCDRGYPMMRRLTDEASGKTIFPDFLQTFHGKHFKASIATGAGWLNEIRRDPNTGEMKLARGVYTFTVNELIARYNFTLEVFQATGGGGTGIEVNGTWIGAVGDAYNGIADFGFPCGRNIFRDAVVTHAFAISYEWLTFASGEPTPYFSWKAIYWPLSPIVWLYSVISSLAAILGYVVLHKILGQPVPMLTVMKYLFSTLLEQSKKTPFRNQSTLRVITAFWLIFALVIGCAYRSKLVSFLAFPNKESPPKSFSELADTTDYKIGLQYMKGIAYQVFKTSTNPIYQKIYDVMELEPSDSQCLKNVLPGSPKGKYICIAWSAVIDHVRYKNLSDRYDRVPLVKASETVNFIMAGIVAEYDAIFLEKFNDLIKWATACGLVFKWQIMDFEFVSEERKDWLESLGKRDFLYPTFDSDSLTLPHLSGSFYILFLGLGMGMMGFFGEVFTRYRFLAKNKVLRIMVK